MALRSGRVGIHPSQVDPITGMLLNGPTPGSMSLSALQDVQITDPEDGAYLTYDSASSKWVNTTTPPAPVVPEGSTVTPTDDIQTWLACAGITDKSYTTLNEVLADSTTLLALMSDNNAVDYLVRSTTWASGVTANSTAMTDIGANNYCANTLLDDATWCTAICNSTYFESVLTTKVPTMTSNTTPSGVASASSEITAQYAAWKAFNSSETYGWYCESGAKGYPVGSYIQYEFPSAVKIYMVKAMLKYEAVTYSIKMKFNGSNDGTTWSNDLLSDFTVSQTNPSSESTGIFTSTGNYTIYRAESTQQATSNRTLGFKMQFYGR